MAISRCFSRGQPCKFPRPHAAGRHVIPPLCEGRYLRQQSLGQRPEHPRAAWDLQLGDESMFREHLGTLAGEFLVRIGGRADIPERRSRTDALEHAV
jgi:hypothetical protein